MKLKIRFGGVRRSPDQGFFMLNFIKILSTSKNIKDISVNYNAKCTQTKKFFVKSIVFFLVLWYYIK